MFYRTIPSHFLHILFISPLCITDYYRFCSLGFISPKWISLSIIWLGILYCKHPMGKILSLYFNVFNRWFFINHIYSAVLFDFKTQSGEISAIFSGWKPLREDNKEQL